MRRAAIAVLVLVAFLAGSGALARDRRHMYSLEEAFNTADFQDRLDQGIQFFFGEQPHPAVARELGEFVTNKKTNAFNKSDHQACEWVFLAAMISLQDRAKAEGGNAVVNIRSYYKKREVSSETEFECTAGRAVAGVALIGEVVGLE